MFAGIFNVEFLDSLAHIAWPEFSDDYKLIVDEILYEEYGWRNKGQDVIEEYLGKTIHNADMIVTYNLKDFIDPFGRIRVMNLDMFLSPEVQEALF